MGAGPAALCIASELIKQDLKVQAIASNPPHQPWPNTYGIWAEELEELGMANLLGHRWSNTVSFFGDGIDDNGNHETNHYFDYGLFDQEAFRKSLLEKCKGLTWINETVESLQFVEGKTQVRCSSGKCFLTRVVIDASGHGSKFVSRPFEQFVAQQAAYGIVGRFSSPPVQKEQFVLMDFRSDHLNEMEKRKPPSFLYAMDFGDDIYFVEETSLACAPPLSFELLKERLYLRMSKRGIQIKEIMHEEHCLFPMNLPLPYLSQPLLAFGGSASMVHPASGYMVGALLRRAPSLAKELADVIAIEPKLTSAELAKKGWNVLWTRELVQRHRLYQFGL